MEISETEDAIHTRLKALDPGTLLYTGPPPTREEIEPEGASGRSLMGAWAWFARGGGVTSVRAKLFCLRPLNPKLPNPRPGLAPTPPGPSLDPAPHSAAAARPRPQPLALQHETPPPVYEPLPSAPKPEPRGPAPKSTQTSTLLCLASL